MDLLHKHEWTCSGIRYRAAPGSVHGMLLNLRRPVFDSHSPQGMVFVPIMNVVSMYCLVRALAGRGHGDPQTPLEPAMGRTWSGEPKANPRPITLSCQ